MSAAALAAALALVGPANLWGQAAPNVGARAWRPVTPDRLLKPEPADWGSYRRSYDVTGFSPLRQVDKGNVAQLRSVWSYSVPDNSRWFPTPIVVNGVMYMVEGGGRVVAFDATTGDILWMHQRNYPQDIAISQGFNRARGLAIYDDVLYWGTADCHLVALDARTGKLLWEVQTGDYRSGDGHNHPPLVADGKVFMGHAGGDRTVKGRFRAFDARTGKLLWTVKLAPDRGEPGFETWPTRFGPLGAAPWGTVSYDPELQLVYFGTGQPSPWSSAFRGPGKALFANCILAVDARTGKIRWYFQVQPDDWDREAAYEGMLVDLNIGGRKRKALIETSKIGWGVILDRETGKYISSFRTAYENVVTGYSKDGSAILDPTKVPEAKDVDSGKVFQICPHFHGARNLQSPSYSPVTGYYYLGVNNSCMDGRVTSVEYAYGRNFAGSGGRATLVPGYDYVGEFVAFKPETGERAWTYRAPGGVAMSASALSTAGGLVFGGTVDRQFFALDADSGKLLWQTRLNGDVSGAPVTFEVDGRQYVAIAAGGKPGPTTTFAPLSNVQLSEGSAAMWVFALPDRRDVQPMVRAAPVALQTSGVTANALQRTRGGADGPVVLRGPAPATAGSGSAGVPGLYSADQAAAGEQVFRRSCLMCHTVADQTGAAFRAKYGTGTAASVFNLIATTMPQREPGSLPKEEYAAVVAFMLSQSGYAPGASALPTDPKSLSSMKLAPPAD